MSDTTQQIDKDKEVDFSYPNGFNEAVASLDFLPGEEQRIQMIAAIAAFNQ
jgi:hypothetical protein